MVDFIVAHYTQINIVESGDYCKYQDDYRNDHSEVNSRQELNQRSFENAWLFISLLCFSLGKIHFIFAYSWMILDKNLLDYT